MCSVCMSLAYTVHFTCLQIELFILALEKKKEIIQSKRSKICYRLYLKLVHSFTRAEHLQ